MSTHREFTDDEWYTEKLPKPPVPSLDRTLERYLQYASVLVKSPAHGGGENGELSMNKTNMAVSRFFPIAEKLQNELTSIADTSKNWVNEFWLPEMYLKQRLPLPVNFNPAYVFPRQEFRNELDQLDYSAWMVRGIMEFKDKIDKRMLPRDINRGRVNSKLCMAQYDRLLDCYREAAFDADVHHNHRKNADDYSDPSTEHILVMCDCQMFIIFTRILGKLIEQSELLSQLKTVTQIAANRHLDSVTPMGAATVGNRDDAARFWLIIKEAPINVTSLNWVRAASFVLCIDRNESPFLCVPYDKRHNEIERVGLHVLHGFGSASCGLNRWFDATIQLIVTRSGISGLCIEHSVAEGIVIINMAESALCFTYENRARENYCPVTVLTNNSSMPVRVRPLSWVINEDARQILVREAEDFERLVKEMQLRVLFFDDFGKTTIKLLRVSPDGFAQLAMQLAHFRLHGYLVSTYESATMRKFQFGRVDNIRASTPEALEWVRVMDDVYVDSTTKKLLFRKAADKQSLVTQENVNGEGIDNHLCALDVLARNELASGRLNEMPEFFTDRMWMEMMRFPLSTSQVTTSPALNGCYLFYGAVVEDGYGCAYNIQENRLIFAISSFLSNRRTDIDGFRANLAHALCDMHALLHDT